MGSIRSPWLRLAGWTTSAFMVGVLSAYTLVGNAEVPDAARPGGESATSSSSIDHGRSAPVPQVTLSPIERRTRQREYRVLRASVPYETVADAKAAGFVSLHADEGSDDVHLVNWSRMDGVFDPAAPEQLLAASGDDEGRILAVVNYVISDSSYPPQGYTGSADVWHEHRGVCIDGTRARGENVTASDCARLGSDARLVDGWMLHLWVMPDYPNPDGFCALRLRSPAIGET